MTCPKFWRAMTVPDEWQAKLDDIRPRCAIFSDSVAAVRGYGDVHGVTIDVDTPGEILSLQIVPGLCCLAGAESCGLPRGCGPGGMGLDEGVPLISTLGSEPRHKSDPVPVCCLKLMERDQQVCLVAGRPRVR